MGDFNGHVAVTIGAMGPYHHARLNALHQVMAGHGCEFTLILRNGFVSEYPWFEDAGAVPYRVIRAYEESVPEPSARVSAGQLWNALQEVKPDAVAFGMPSPAYFSVLAWAVRYGRKALLFSESKKDDSERSGIKEAMKKVLYRGFDGAVVGGDVHADYAASLGIPRSRCFEGYDVVDNDHFRHAAAAARENAESLREQLNLPAHYFVAANRFVEKKNLIRLLTGFADYRKRAGIGGWKLVMLGDGPEMEMLLEKCRQLDLSDDVLFKGLAGYDDLPVYYGLAEAFIHASTVEQWGLVANEAMASGAPVLLSETCGCRSSLLKEGVNGYSFDPFSADDIAEAMSKFHALDPAERETMGSASREIISHWGPERFGEAVWSALNACQ